MICTIASSGEEVFLSNEGIQVLKQRILMDTIHLLKQGYADFYVNCNYGVPMWAAETLLSLKKEHPLKLHIAAPHEEQYAHWIEDHRKRYITIVEQSDDIYYVSKPYVPDSYQCADEYMVEHSDLLLVYETKDMDLYIAAYAKDMGVKIQFIRYNQIGL